MADNYRVTILDPEERTKWVEEQYEVGPTLRHLLDDFVNTHPQIELLTEILDFVEEIDADLYYDQTGLPRLCKKLVDFVKDWKSENPHLDN